MARSKEKMEPIEFLAILSPVLTAIKRSGRNEGMRVQLDISESEMPNAIRLNLCGEKVLKVRIEVEDENLLINKTKQGDGETRMEAGAKRKSQWTTA